MRNQYLARGYSLVYTPHVMRRDLWKVSGHADYYSENMFKPMELDDAEYQLKPMNCPGHILIYRDKKRSYRELPVRLGELGTVYRYERSGTMHGLMRVRGFTQDDAHIFCTPEQIEDEIVNCLEFAADTLKTFGFDKYEAELSTWDGGASGKYDGAPEQWQLGENALHKATRPSQPERQGDQGRRPRSTVPRSTSSWWTPSAACGSFRRCSSTSRCRASSAWSTSPKTVKRISR